VESRGQNSGRESAGGTKSPEAEAKYEMSVGYVDGFLWKFRI